MSFCSVCKTLMRMGRCPLCIRPPPNDEGTRREPQKPPAASALHWKTCRGCGGKVSPRSKHEYCFECREAQDPAAVREKEYDENHPSR